MRSMQNRHQPCLQGDRAPGVSGELVAQGWPVHPGRAPGVCVSDWGIRQEDDHMSRLGASPVAMGADAAVGFLRRNHMACEQEAGVAQGRQGVHAAHMYNPGAEDEQSGLQRCLWVHTASMACPRPL